MFTDFTGLASHFSRKRKEEEAAELAARREEARRRQEEKVVGGVYRLDPVNKEAAMLLAKAPWFFHPPQGEPKFEEKNQQKEKQKMKDMTPEQMGKSLGETCHRFGMDRSSQGSLEKTYSELAQAVLNQIEKNGMERVGDIVRKQGELAAQIGRSVQDTINAADSLDKALKSTSADLMMQRMSVVSECAKCVNALRDVRQFFFGPDYDKEQKRLAEFVELCERLKALKDSGFLDTVADTMIRLAAYEKA